MLKRVLRQLPALLGVLLLVGAIYVVQKEFRNLKIADIRAALDAIPNTALVFSFIWTLLSYFILTFYDRLGTFYAGRAVSYGRVAFASFCAYSLAHNLGFAAVSGAAVRYRLYAHWGLTPLQIGKVVAFCSLTFGLGGMVLGGIILLWEPEAVPFFGALLPHWAMYAIALTLWTVVAAYITLSRMVGVIRVFGHQVELPSWRMAILQVLLATVDVAVTAAIFYALLPSGIGLNYVRFLGVYVASYTAGLAANLPGGLGVFDTAMLLGLQPYLQPPEIIGAIVVFRLYYYIIPLFLAGTLFAGNELLLRGRGVMAGPAKLKSVQAIGRWSQPDFAAAAGTGAVGLCGALLLSLGVLHAAVRRGAPDMLLGASEFVTSLVGSFLMVLAVGLAQRVNMAWSLSLVLLGIAAAGTALNGESVWVPLALCLAALSIAPFHRTFYRKARLFSTGLQVGTVVPLLALVGCILALSNIAPRVRWLDNDSWWVVIMSRDVPDTLRIAMALAVIFGLLALWALLRPGHVHPAAYDREGRAGYAALGSVPPAMADGLIWGENGSSAIAFRRVGSLLVGLGDPAGAASDQASAIWRLRDLARQEKRHPAVWQAGPGLLDIYADLGLTGLPLDADGVPMADAEEEPSPHATSFLVCQAERDLPELLKLLPALARLAPDHEGQI
jgi:uncharacterized membrane protein YbhN (UPF0104 family)